MTEYNSCKVITVPSLLLLLLISVGNNNANNVLGEPFDFNKFEPIANTNIHTGNKVLFEREINGNSTLEQQLQNLYDVNGDVGTYMDVNELPVRYDETQLWRIYNISDSMRKMLPIGSVMENKFGGNIWK